LEIHLSKIKRQKKKNKIPSVPADENQNICPQCGEQFEQYFDSEQDEWMYKDTILLDAIIYHQKCSIMEDSTQSIVLVNTTSPPPSTIITEMKEEEEKEEKEEKKKEDEPSSSSLLVSSEDITTPIEISKQEEIIIQDDNNYSDTNEIFESNSKRLRVT